MSEKQPVSRAAFVELTSALIRVAKRLTPKGCRLFIEYLDKIGPALTEFLDKQERGELPPDANAAEYILQQEPIPTLYTAIRKELIHEPAKEKE